MKKNNAKITIRRFATCAVLAVITAAMLLLTACGAAGVIKNGSFEKNGSGGLPADWTFSSYYGNTAKSNAVAVQDASRGQVVKLTNLEPDDAHFVQTIGVKENTIYRLSCYIKTENVQGGAGANIGLDDLSCYSTPIFGTNDWTLVELVGKTGSNQTKLTVGCRLGNFGGVSTGTAYYDDFKIEKLDSYSGTVESFGQGGSSDSNKDVVTKTSDPQQYKARMTTAFVTIAVYLIVPLAVACILWFEHAADKRRGGEPIKTPAMNAPSIFDTKPNLPKKTDTRLRYTKLDWIFVIALTLVYAVLAVTNLGSTHSPDSEWRGDRGRQVTFVFSDTVTIGSIWQHGGITNSGNYTLTAENGAQVTAKQEFGIMYRWSKIDVPSSVDLTTKTLNMTVKNPEVWLNELAFFDKAGNLLPVTVSDSADLALVDEQSYVPEYPNYMVGMYFDELYHARTAYEHLHNMKVYEVSHPPLGKVLISVGVAIFGMNPFGWRIIGALFGVAMIPLMYAFGKRMFGRSGLALLAAGLMAFDFMHYSQTRISTIDVYGVFFNLCMTYYMYKFIKMDLGDSLKSTLLPLALSGIFFGIGCASKWICVYTGAALAAMFFIKLTVLGIKAKKINKVDLSESEKKSPAAVNARTFGKRATLTCLWCVIFFVILPLIIYAASYYPYYTAEWRPNAENTKIAQMRASGELAQNEPAPASVLTIGEKAKAYINGVIKNQEYMYNYHSKLNSTHAYQSAWYEWPLSNRPMWFYAGYHNPDKTMYGTISSFGNPAVWWVCFAGTIFLVIMTLRGRFKVNTEVFFIFMCMASSMLPWMLVSRCVFIYHYFATVPLIILASVYVLKHYEDKLYYVPKELGQQPAGFNKAVPYVKYAWIALAVILFAVFYPVITGIPVKKSYIEALQWLPTWTFTGYWPSIWP